MTIDPKRVKEIFLEAAELSDEAARTAYLDHACGGDAGLRARVEALLRSHEPEGSFLGAPAAVLSYPDQATPQTFAAPANPAVAPGADPAVTEAWSKASDAVPSGHGASRTSTDEEPLTFLAPPKRPDSLGRIGHYEVLQVLGRGGFGIVFRAFDEMLQRVVALKVMAPQLAATSPARKRFLREARSSAQVRHENVVQVYEVAEQPLPYLAMELIPGETLQQRLDRVGPIEPAEAVRIGRQIAEGLAAAHAMDLIHRDIKPGNVLLEGGQHKVKITDFGLARTADDASISQSGIIAGTPMYMAPEQAQGQTLDQRADLFGLGSVLYQMVTGRPPFRANTTVAVLKRVAEDKPRAIREIIPETPQWLCDIIAKLHAKDPDDRYQSAREVADVLADCEAQLKANAKLKDYSRIPRRKLQRSGRRKWVAAAAAVLLPVIALVVTEFAGVTHLFGGRDSGRSTSPKVVRGDIPGWGTTIDPKGDCAFRLDGDSLIVDVPGGEHNLNPTPQLNDVSAPRVLQVTEGDFQMETRVQAFAPPATGNANVFKAHNGVCLVLWQDAKNFARFERAANGATGSVSIHLECFRNGELVDNKIWEIRNTSVLLRVARNGTVFRFSYSTDEANWNELALEKSVRFPAQLQAGVAVINTTANQFAARFSQFRFQRGNSSPGPPSPAIAPFTDADVQRIAGLPDRRAAEYVLSLGGIVRVNDEDRDLMVAADLPRERFRLTGVRLPNNQQVSDAGLAAFKGCKNVKELDVCRSRITDAGLAYFKDCQNLTQLEVSHTQITDAGAAYFKGRTNLTFLSLYDTQVSEAGLAYFKDNKRLRVLALTNVSDAGLSNFKDCKDLMQFFLDSTGVSDAGLIPFRGCKALKLLGLHGTNVGDAGLACFKDCKNLTLLQLDNTRVGDAGLTHFKGTPLTSLSIFNTSITDLTPLQGMSLEDIRLTPKNITQGMHILCDMKSLKTIGIDHKQAWPAAEFWERYDEGEFK